LTPQFKFTRNLRITHKRDFQRLHSSRLRARNSFLTLALAPNDLPHPRLGIIVSKKCGNAVKRNRIKRHIREAFRLSRHELPPGYDMAVYWRPGRESELKQVQAALVALAVKAKSTAGTGQ